MDHDRRNRVLYCIGMQEKAALPPIGRGVADSRCYFLPGKHLNHLLPVCLKCISPRISQHEVSYAAQTLAGVRWVPQFRGRRRASERTIVKYSDRGEWHVYIAAAQPACRIMGVSRRWCCRRSFASAGLGIVRWMEGSRGIGGFRCDDF
jgi:hypothetical protein